jgi:DNA (cytosine-5)-methyltransferase 1
MTKNHPAPADRLVSVDLFSGPGGLTLGLERAGFECLMAVEFETDACKTFKSHHPNSDLRDTDISTVDFSGLRGEVDLVAGGPPCQPFSSGGKRLAASDPRNGIPQFIRAVTEIQPRAVLMENVPGLAAGEKKQYLEDEVVARLEGLGYQVEWKVLHAADYGVPQKRRRLTPRGPS